MTDSRGTLHVTWNSIDLAFCRVLGVIHVSLGTVTAIGGADRFPPPNYSALLAFSNGRVWPYAIAWVAGGVLMSVCKPVSWRIAGLAISVLITNLWAALFLVSALWDKEAAFTGTVAYGGYGLLSALLLGMMLVHGRPRKRGG